MAVLNAAETAKGKRDATSRFEYLVRRVADVSSPRLLDDHFVLCADSDLNIVADANLRMGGHRPAVRIGQRYLGLASSFELRRHHFVVAARLA